MIKVSALVVRLFGVGLMFHFWYCSSAKSSAACIKARIFWKFADMNHIGQNILKICRHEPHWSDDEPTPNPDPLLSGRKLKMQEKINLQTIKQLNRFQKLIPPGEQERPGEWGDELQGGFWLFWLEQEWNNTHQVLLRKTRRFLIILSETINTHQWSTVCNEAGWTESHRCRGFSSEAIVQCPMLYA